MGCALDAGINKQFIDINYQNRHGRTLTIDTRRQSSKVVDKVIQNVIIDENPITKQQINFASNIFNKLTLFNTLTNQQILIISSLLISATAEMNQYIFHQGDSGNCFFLIEKGQVQVLVDGKSVKVLSQGDTFGQLALILRTYRSASIKTKTKCKFLVMKPLIFKSTMEKIKTNEYQMKRNAIQNVQIFQGLNNKQKVNLTNALKIMMYQKGQKIVSKDQIANAFYVINQGKVSVQLPNHKNRILSKFQCFGQSAFKNKGRRACTITAIERTICSIISKEDFQSQSGIRSSSIYFYNMKKWALQKSKVFKGYSKYIKNTINLAFETIQVKANTKINNKGLVICLQGKINGKKQGQCVFGQNQWEQKSQDYKTQLIQEEDGFYAFIDPKKLTDLLKTLKQKRQSKILLSSLANNKLNRGIINLSSFQYIKDLGQGQFGTVKLVRDTKFGQLYALKQITKSSIKKQVLQKYIEEERKILSKIEFPYIVGFVKAFSDKQNVYFLMQYIKGVQLFNVIRQMPSLNKTIARYFFACIVSAIQHLHDNGIIYRDIKPQNAVVDYKGKVYVIDMGTAKVLEKQKSYRTFTVIGTPHYMAPQVFQARGYSFQADIWSLGVILYELICNALPFGQDEEDTYKVMQCIKKKSAKFPKNLNPQTEQILKLMLNKNHKQRAVNATFDNIKSSKFFKGFEWQQLLLQHIFPPYIPRIFKQKNQLKQQQHQGKPLIQQLYPKSYARGTANIEFKQWNQNISF